MDKLSEAINLVTVAFEGKTRKCENYPAVFHSLEAGYIAQTLTDDKDIIIATILHDTVEDAGYTFEEIENRFGKRVADLVRGESEDKREAQNPRDTWQVRKKESIEALKGSSDIGLKIMFMSDKLSNMRSMYRSKLKQGDSMWNAFNQKNPKEHYWYYSTIAEALSEFSDTLAYKEYITLIRKTFSEE